MVCLIKLSGKKWFDNNILFCASKHKNLSLSNCYKNLEHVLIIKKHAFRDITLYWTITNVR